VEFVGSVMLKADGFDAAILGRCDDKVTGSERLVHKDLFMSSLSIPKFPFSRCSEKEAMRDYVELTNMNCLELIEKQPWKSRSELPEEAIFNYVIKKNNIGNKSSNFFHWQARVSCDSNTAPSPIRAWYDEKLRKNIESSVYYKQSHSSALTMRGYVPSQFRPSAAKAVYQLFNAKKIYDPCGGWGDRLCGALASNSIFYYCRDVNPMVFSGYSLQQKNYASGVQTAFEYKGSEVDCPKEGYFDLVFTSPPYWKVEKYQGSKQSYLLYKKFDSWMQSFLLPMMTNAWLSLQDGGTMIMNISDCYANHTYNKICEPLIDYAISNLPDCYLMGIIGYEISKRKKNGVNAEPMIVFRKGNSASFAELLPESKQTELDI